MTPKAYSRDTAFHCWPSFRKVVMAAEDGVFTTLIPWKVDINKTRFRVRTRADCPAFMYQSVGWLLGCFNSMGVKCKDDLWIMTWKGWGRKWFVFVRYSPRICLARMKTRETSVCQIWKLNSLSLMSKQSQIKGKQRRCRSNWRNYLLLMDTV